MDAQTEQRSACIYTIGHSNHTMETFINLLTSHGIEVLVDVRSQPYSRFSPHFSRQGLEAAIMAAGIRYLFMGKELGGRPEGDQYYDDAGHVDYGRVEDAAFFKDGITRLENGIGRYKVAMMCSEEDPAGCHRRLLVGRVLADRGTQLLHIRGDGHIDSEDKVRGEEMDGPEMQPSLFPDIDEVQREWKSIRSVSPREARQASSER